MTKENELQKVEQTQGELIVKENTQDNSLIDLPTITGEDNNYVYFVDKKGKHFRKAKYEDYTSIVPVDRKEMIWLANIMDSDEENGTPLKNAIGQKIEIQDVIIKKYDRVNEETGQIEHGAITYLFTPEKELYATSSLSVLFKLKEYFELFNAKPDDENWENLIVEIGSRKAEKGDAITIKLVG